MENIKVLIIDDSALVRQVLGRIINEAPGMEVLDVAFDPIFAIEKLKTIKPDVITLDIEMPRMDGLTFLKQLMHEHPYPVVMCSKLTNNSVKIGLDALKLGAVAVVDKPLGNVKMEMQQQASSIVDAIRAASKVSLENLVSKANHNQVKLEPREKYTADAVLQKADTGDRLDAGKMIAMGASTGGTNALEYVLSQLDADTPGVLVVQHMPGAFTAAFAERLDAVSEMFVKEAVDGDSIEAGKVLIAPGGQHMMVELHDGQPVVAVKSGPLVSRHCPSVDVLFRSVAKFSSSQTMGIIMTGMGDDGAAGMKEMFDRNAFTIAQDQASCVVYGMPAKAVKHGGVSRICSLVCIPEMINSFSRPNEFNQIIEVNACISPGA